MATCNPGRHIMSGLAELGNLWHSIQTWLFPLLEDELGELDDRHRECVAVCETCDPRKHMTPYRWIGNADTFTYFVEAKYKFTPNLFAAVRWNQQLFDTVPDGAGGAQHWDRNISRVDTALGYRFTRHLQGKVQYSFAHENGPVQQGEQLLAAQLTIKF